MALNSSARFKVVDLLCEGPIEGLATVDPSESVFLNDIAIVQAGENRYKGVNFDFFPGTDSEKQGTSVNFRRHGIENTVTLSEVNQELGHNYEETLNPSDSNLIASRDSRDYGQGSVFYKVTNPDVEIIQPIITVNALYSTSVQGASRGMLFAAAVDLRISLSDGDGRKVYEDFKLIKGVVTNGYQVSLNKLDISSYKKPVTLRVHKKAQVRSNNNYVVPIYEQNQIVLPDYADHYFYVNDGYGNATGIDYTKGGGTGQKDDYLAREAAFVVNINSVTDHPEPTLFPFGNGRANSVTLTAVKEIKYTSVPYSYSAIASVHISTEDFPQLPTRSYLIKGLLLQVPNNAFPRADGSLQFRNNFDGTLSRDRKWTTCPVAAWYEMSTNNRFGAGLPAENFSWIDLYPLCRYANERLLIDGVSATYSTPFVDQNTGLSNVNIDRSAHGFETGDTIFVVFTSGPLAETNKVVYEFKVVAVDLTTLATLAIGQNLYREDQGPDMSVHTQGGNCMISKKAEPRFAANIVMASQGQAYEVLQDLASIFRGMTYWHQNSIQATADHGELYKVNEEQSVIDPVHLFTNANVTEGGFSYEGTGLSTRSTSVKVTYNDPENGYTPDFVCVEDVVQRDRYGHREREVVGIGCTSRTQAMRMARWVLASEQLSDTVIRFSTGLEGALVLPGQVFAVADEVRSSVVGISGRVAAKHAANQIKIDRDLRSFFLGLSGTPSVTITCVIADGLVEKKEVDVAASTTNTTNTTHEADSVTGKVRQIINLASGQSFSQAPVAGAAYSISYTATGSSVAEEKYRCLGIEDNGDGTFTVNGVKHDDSIYKTTDSNTFKVEKTVTTGYSQVPDPPRNLKITFRRVIIRGTVFYRAALSYQRGAKGVVTRTEVDIFIDGSEKPISSFSTPRLSNTFELEEDIAQGQVIEFRVKQLGLNQKWVEASITKEAGNTNVDQDFRTAVETTFAPPDVGVQKQRGIEEYSSIFDRAEVVGSVSEKSDLTISFVEGKTPLEGRYPGLFEAIEAKDRSGNYAVTVAFSGPEQTLLAGLTLEVRHTNRIISGQAAESDWNQARIITSRDAALTSSTFNLAWIPGTYMFRYASTSGESIVYSPGIVTRVAPEIKAHESSSSSSLTLPNSNPPPLFRTHRLLAQDFSPILAATTNDFEVVDISPTQTQLNTLRLKSGSVSGKYFVPVPGGLDDQVLDLGDVFEVEIESYIAEADLQSANDCGYKVHLLVWTSDDPYYPEDELFLQEDDSKLLQENDSDLQEDNYGLSSTSISINGRAVVTARRFRFAFLFKKTNPAAHPTTTPIIKEMEVRIYARYNVYRQTDQVSNDVNGLYDNYKTHENSFSPLAPTPAVMFYDNALGQYSSSNAINVGSTVVSTDTVASTSINMNVTQAVEGVTHGVKAMTEGVRYTINQLDSNMTTADWQDIGWTGTTPAVNDIFICKKRPRSGQARVTQKQHVDNTAGVVPKGKHYIIGIFNSSSQPIRCRYSYDAVGYGKTAFPNA